MARVRAEDILKPGAKLEVVKIDFNSPEVVALVKETRRQQEILKRMGRDSKERRDLMRRVVNL